MSRAQQRRLALRDEGRHRATVASRAAMIAGTALAAVFGVVLAQHSAAAAKPSHANAPVAAPRTAAPATSTTTQAPATTTTTPAPTTIAPTTTQAPVLQPPAQAPAPAQGGGQGSSGGS